MSGAVIFTTTCPYTVWRISIGHESYLDAVIEKVDEALARFAVPGAGGDGVQRARRASLRLIEKGDPYQRQIEDTVQLLVRAGWME